MKRLIVAGSLAFFLLSSCASGRVNWRERGYGGQEASEAPAEKSSAAKPRRVQKDSVATRKSSYRVRGTDVVGSLNSRQHAALRAKTRDWRWPLNQVALTSQFGYRHGDFHDGVDLRAQTGTPVYSVAPGTVIYSGSKIRGYGRMVVIRHPGKLSTIYAHNSKLYVKPGQKIRRGQLIAQSGNTGRSTGPHVHFEIREGVTAINPAILLQSPNVHNQAYRRIAQAESNRDKLKTQSSARRVEKQRRVAKQRKPQPRGKPAARLASSDGEFKARVNRRTQ